MLIDDDRILTPEQVRLAFPAPAHTVVVACTGAKGLELVSTVPPDVILLDLRLPDQCGRLPGHVRSQPQETPPIPEQQPRS